MTYTPYATWCARSADTSVGAKQIAIKTLFCRVNIYSFEIRFKHSYMRNTVFMYVRFITWQELSGKIMHNLSFKYNTGYTAFINENQSPPVTARAAPYFETLRGRNMREETMCVRFMHAAGGAWQLAVLLYLQVCMNPLADSTCISTECHNHNKCTPPFC